MPTHKFVNYQKINGDEHINARLENEKNAKVPFEITEIQLMDRHVDEKNSTFEKLLEKNRKGNPDSILEKSLNDFKSEFGSKFRNESAYSGDINKLEEQRMKSAKTEKYEDASSVQKKNRWWEEKEAKGLVIANRNEKIASWDDDVDYSYLDDMYDNVGKKKKSKYKEYDPVEDDPDFFADIDDDDDEDEWKYKTDDDETNESEISFSEMNFIEDNSTGTTTYNGTLQLDPQSYWVTSVDDAWDEIVQFFKANHPEVNLSDKSINSFYLSDDHTISFSIAGNNFNIDEFEGDIGEEGDIDEFGIDIDTEASSYNFPIVIAKKK